MKLAFSTNAFTRFPLDQALKGIKDAGFSAAEILADVPHAYPPTLTTAAIDAVVKTLSSTELSVSNINCNCSFGYWKDAPPEPYFEPSLISPNPQHRADRTRMIFTTLDFAKAVGAPNISITSGRCLGAMDPQKAAAQFRESIRPVLDRAEALNVGVGIELEPGLFLEWATELRHWIDELGSPMFGANLDIGHSVVLGETVTEAVETLRGRIWNMHVEDLPGRKHYHTIPGDGTFPWQELAKVLDDIDYDRYLTVELYTMTEDPHTAARRSFEFLSNLFI